MMIHDVADRKNDISSPAPKPGMLKYPNRMATLSVIRQDRDAVVSNPRQLYARGSPRARKSRITIPTK